MATLPKAYALFETTLQDTITSSANAMTLITGTDKDGSALSGTIGFIIDEGSASEEFVLGSVTGTAVTSMTRGISVADGTTEVAGLKKAHRKGASIKITNHPLLIRLYRVINGDDAFPDNPQTLGDSSQLASSAAPTADADICNKKYADDLAIAGAPNATTTVKGISEIATDAELAAGTGTGGTGASTVATGSSFNETAAAGKVPVGDSGGKIGADWGGSASTLATLDGSSKVVEDPANATATPTASKIPISDATGKIGDGWLGLTAAGDLMYSDGTDVQPLGIGTANQLLQTNSGATAPEWTTQAIIETVASDVLQQSADTERSEVGAAYVKVKEIRVKLGGTLRVKFDLKDSVSVGANPSYGRIYIDGVAVGTEQTVASTTYQTFSEDITNLTGEYYLIQLYIHGNGASGSTALTENFQLYYDVEPVSDTTVVTD